MVYCRYPRKFYEESWQGVMGVFAIYNEHASDSTVVSNLFIDEYMKDANDAQIKVYLYLLRRMSAGEPTSIGDIADRFNHTEREVMRSLRYWERQGLLVLQTDSAGNLTGIRLREPRPVSVSQTDHQVIPITPIPAAREDEHLLSAAPVQRAVPDSAAGDPDRVSAAELAAFQERDSSRQLLFIVESYIGKPLSVSEMKTVYFISSSLHFSNELIDYLVDYCVSRGKKDFRYIEKVALNWAEEGITTADQAREAVQKGRGKSRRTGTRRASRPADFNNFRQNSYDFTELEKQLLSQ